MSQVKICPKCRVEYYAHVTHCADCGLLLKYPEELQAIVHAVSQENEWVEVRHDAKGWIEELSDMLTNSGVPSRVELADGCRPGSCGAQYRLLVPTDAAEEAMRMIEDYFVEMHPEAGQADEWASEGRCPACGHPVDAEMKECPDCGLSLAAAEEDRDGGTGRSCR